MLIVQLLVQMPPINLRLLCHVIELLQQVVGLAVTQQGLSASNGCLIMSVKVSDKGILFLMFLK
jgi:hypothetical protein